MPTKDFHHCRLFPPSQVRGPEIGGEGCRTTERESNGKTYKIRTCELKGKPGRWKEQSFLYSREVWSLDLARGHCQEKGGKFEAALPNTVRKEDLPEMKLVRMRGPRTEEPPGQYL